MESNDDKEELGKILLPLIRKVTPSMIAQDLVDVQPMGPVDPEKDMTEEEKIWYRLKNGVEEPYNPGEIFDMKITKTPVTPVVRKIVNGKIVEVKDNGGDETRNNEEEDT